MHIMETVLNGVESVLDRIESFFENPLGLIITLGLGFALIGIGMEAFHQVVFR